MKNQIQNASISDQITLDNPNKVAWGPNNFLAIASENIVTIYQLKDKKLDVFHKITKHKAKITAISWNIPTVEFYKPNSFDILLAVGDEDGNCLIYDIFTLSRRGGISPENCSPSLSIFDIKWKLDDASTLFILTAQPSLISISVGTTEILNRSKMKLLSIDSIPYHSINITLLWIQNIELDYKRISIDLYDSNRILISSPQNFNYFAMKINTKNKSNRQSTHQNVVSDVLKYPIDESEKLLHVEYFPFRPNCLLLLTNQHLYLFNLFTKAISSIISYNHLKPFCICNGIFSHSISDRFWIATVDGSIYRSSINDRNERDDQDIGDQWTIDSMISSPKAQVLLGIYTDYLNPSRICAVFKDGIAIIKEFPNTIINKNSNNNQISDSTLNHSHSLCFNNSEKPNFYQFLNQAQSSMSKINQSNSHGSNHIEKQEFYQIFNDQDQKNKQNLIYNDANQKVFIFKHKYKLFITTYLPSITDQLISWTTNKGRIAFLSSSGYVTILSPKSDEKLDEDKENETNFNHVFNYSNIEDICYRYKINDPQTTQIGFYKDDSVILNGHKLHIINFKQNERVKEIAKKVTKFCIKDDVVAFTPTLSSFELYTINNSSLTKDFASNIKLFCPCYNDKTKWAILLSSPQNTLFVIGYVVSKRYEIDENVYGSIVSIAFENENIFLATSKSIIHKFNLSNGENKSIIFSSVSMRSISIYKNFILACDMSNNCSVLSTENLSVVSTSSCIGKEIQVLNDNYCVVQIKSSQRPVLMLYKFPSLESVRVVANNNITDIFLSTKSISKILSNTEPNTFNSNKISSDNKIDNSNSNQDSDDKKSTDLNLNQNTTNSNSTQITDNSNLNSNLADSNLISSSTNSNLNQPSTISNFNSFSSNSNPFKILFWGCTRIEELETIAHQIGDLSFLHFIQVIKGNKDTILPSVYSITREKAILNEKCFSACNIQNSAFVDEYIEYLILSNQFERAARFALLKVNKQNILLAQACLSPNAEAVKKIMKFIPSIKGSEKIFSLLLKIGGDSEEAANTAFRINDSLTSIKFLKLICDDIEIKKFIKLFKTYKENYLTMAFADDYQNAFTILLNSNEISKAYAYMTFIEEKINQTNNNNNNKNAIENDKVDDNESGDVKNNMMDLFFDNIKIQIKEEWKRLMPK